MDWLSTFEFNPGQIYLIPGHGYAGHAKNCSTVVIEGFGTGLPPMEIRERIRTYKQISYSKDIIIIIVTSSVIAMNEFGTEISAKNVLVPVNDKLIPLDVHMNPAYLSHFRIGDLYECVDFKGI